MAGVTMAPGRQAGRRPSVSARLAGLARAVEGIRGKPRLEVRTVMLWVGSICMGLGIVAILLGWYGAAHSTYLFQEIPYLISGGLLGVALVAGGGFLFFAAWLVRLIDENRRYTARVAQTLARVDRALEALSADPAAATTFGRRAGNGMEAGTGAPGSGRA